MKNTEFKTFAKSWWDLNGPVSTLHAINPLRLNFINQSLDINNKKILDIGCGGGILSESLTKSGGFVTGLDISSDLIKSAKDHAQCNDLSIEYICSDADTFLQSTQNKYDLIIAFEVLEHIEKFDELIQLMAEALNKNGYLIISTINRNAQSFFKSIIAAEYILNIVPRGTHRHDWFIKPSEIIQTCRHCNLTLQNQSGLEFDPISNSFSMSNDMSNNYFLSFKNENL